MLPAEQIHHVVFLNNEIVIGFEGIMISINRFTKIVEDSAWTIPPHAHMNYELHYIFEGAGEIGLGSNVFGVCAGEFYVTPPFVDHSQRTRPSNPMKEYCIECSVALKAEAEDANSLSIMQTISRILYSPHSDPSGILERNLQLLDEIFSRNEHLSGAEELQAKSLFLSSVVHMLLANRTVGESEGGQNQNDINYQRATSVRNYLEANYKQNITVRDCARIFYLSERQIDRILKKVYNETFHQMLARTRVNIAVNLMKNTDLPVERVAMEAGFSGYRQMLRSFKRFGTEQPTKLRKESRSE